MGQSPEGDGFDSEAACPVSCLPRQVEAILRDDSLFELLSHRIGSFELPMADETEFNPLEAIAKIREMVSSENEYDGDETLMLLDELEEWIAERSD